MPCTSETPSPNDLKPLKQRTGRPVPRHSTQMGHGFGTPRSPVPPRMEAMNCAASSDKGSGSILVLLRGKKARGPSHLSDVCLLLTGHDQSQSQSQGLQCIMASCTANPQNSEKIGRKMESLKGTARRARAHLDVQAAVLIGDLRCWTCGRNRPPAQCEGDEGERERGSIEYAAAIAAATLFNEQRLKHNRSQTLQLQRKERP